MFRLTPILYFPLQCFPSLLVTNSCPGYLAGAFHIKQATRLIALQLQLQVFFFPKFGLSLGQIWVTKILGKSFEIVFRSVYQEHTEIETAFPDYPLKPVDLSKFSFLLWISLCTLSMKFMLNLLQNFFFQTSRPTIYFSFFHSLSTSKKFRVIRYSSANLGVNQFLVTCVEQYN